MPRFAGLTLGLTFAALLWAAPSFAAAPFNAARAFADLEKQCSFGPRVPGTKAHEQTADWLVKQLVPLADRVARQRFTATARGRALPLTNIIATFNPRGKERVLFCAHWDTRPTADLDPDLARRDQPIPGANDGASGVAVLLEIARALDAYAPAQQVTLLFLDGEDYGPNVDAMFLGSRYFADHYQGPPLDWAVLLDMVGDKDLRLPQEGYSRAHAPAVVARVWKAAAAANAPAFVSDPGEAVLDDHVSFLQRGLPCIDVIDFTYPYWHTLADTPDKCSTASLGQVGRTLLEALRQ